MNLGPWRDCVLEARGGEVDDLDETGVIQQSSPGVGDCLQLWGTWHYVGLVRLPNAYSCENSHVNFLFTFISFLISLISCFSISGMSS